MSGIPSLVRVVTLRFVVSAAVLDLPAQDRSAPYLEWPAATNTAKPWVYWHWMGSAVDPDNLRRELRRYAAAGLGGVHVIPIYGARGYEDRYIKYLSPRWTEMFGVTLAEARRLGMGVDMTLGTGWNFGGPDIGDRLANANVVVRTIRLARGERVEARFDRAELQALEAYSTNGAEDISNT